MSEEDMADDLPTARQHCAACGRFIGEDSFYMLCDRCFSDPSPQMSVMAFGWPDEPVDEYLIERLKTEDWSQPDCPRAPRCGCQAVCRWRARMIAKILASEPDSVSTRVDAVKILTHTPRQSSWLTSFPARRPPHRPRRR